VDLFKSPPRNCLSVPFYVGSALVLLFVGLQRKLWVELAVFGFALVGGVGRPTVFSRATRGLIAAPWTPLAFLWCSVSCGGVA